MILVLLPAFNEDQAIGSLLDSLGQVFRAQELDGRVLVVNDGSSDHTAEVVKSCSSVPVELLEHPVNKGLSQALQTGLCHGLPGLADRDTVVIMDADNTQSPEAIAEMTGLIRAGQDVVIASRYAPGGKIVGLSLQRKIYSRGASWLFRILLPISGVKDFTCGYRAYRAGLLKQAVQRWGENLLGGSGFSCSVELLLKLHSLGARMTEVPFTLRYDLKPSKSKMKVGRTIQETLLLAWRWRSGRRG